MKASPIVLAILTISIATSSAFADDACTVERLAGSYETGYGEMRCDENGARLKCCYGNLRSCDQWLDLSLSADGKSLRGKWFYSNGRSGAAQFAIQKGCSVHDGFWGAGRRATTAWSVARKAAPNSAPQALPTAAATARSGTPRSVIERNPRITEPSPVSVAPTERGLRVERSLAALGFDPGPVDGVVDEQTNHAIVEWQKSARLQFGAGLTDRQFAFLEQKASEAQARAERRAALDARGPLARFSERIEHNGAVVLVDPDSGCDSEADSLVVIAEADGKIPETGRVLSALQRALDRTQQSCRKNWKRIDVPVRTSEGTLLKERYMYLHTAQPAVILPYSILTPDNMVFLNNDPGYPFARVAPPLINIASGLWEREFTRGGWSQSMGGEAHWQTIAFQFALADAELCKSNIGATTSYQHTVTQTNEFGAVIDSQAVTYEFDKKLESIMLAILSNGNHIGAPIGEGARRLIRTHGCDSEEVARLRRNPITVAATTLNLPVPAGAGHVNQ